MLAGSLSVVRFSIVLAPRLRQLREEGADLRRAQNFVQSGGFYGRSGHDRALGSSRILDHDRPTQSLDARNTLCAIPIGPAEDYPDHAAAEGIGSGFEENIDGWARIMDRSFRRKGESAAIYQNVVIGWS
jgi:hypothetical protein